MKIFQDKSPFYGQDPYAVLYQNKYLLIESQDEERIAIITWRSLDDMRNSVSITVWDNPQEHQVWAPELHLINGRWYIYYSSSNGTNESHRNKALIADSPFGPYFPLGIVGLDIWGIDLTIFNHENKRYAIWSGWEHNGDGYPQHLYISDFENLKERTKISSPLYNWEKSIEPINEGPQAWYNSNGKLCLFFSANASWTQDYCTGLMVLVGEDPLNPDHWFKKPSPLLYNAGHGQPIGDRFLYHKKLSNSPGWQDRVIVTMLLSNVVRDYG